MPRKRKCPICRRDNYEMGRLANKLHYQCQYCGIGYSIPFRKKRVKRTLSTGPE